MIHQDQFVIDILLAIFLLLTVTEIKIIKPFYLNKVYNVPALFFVNILKLLFSYVVVIHAWLLSRGRSAHRKTLIFLVAVAIIIYRFTIPNELSHNLFIFAAVLWIGPLLVNSKIVTQKRFLIISGAWFLYDISYVWLTPLSNIVNTATQSSGFPLGIVKGNSMLGAADLFWAGLFISLAKRPIIAIALLVLSDLALGIYLLRNQTETFVPLLVFWVPISLIYLYNTRKLDL